VGFWVALQLGLVFMLFLFFLWNAIVSISIYGLKCFYVCYLCSFCEIQMSWPISYGWNHIMGGQKCCHIVLFDRGVHVWTLTMVILEHIFPIFLHNMVNYNTNNSITKKSFFQLIVCDFKVYLWQKNVCQLCIKKCKYTQKIIEMICSLYEICSIY